MDSRWKYNDLTPEEFNTLVDGPDFDEFIRVCEARQRKDLAYAADDIVSREDVRLVLIAGGSSAGKTTTAKRLCTHLRVNGFEAYSLSTDDYFVGDSRNPKNPDGTFDYETIEAVDLERLRADVAELVAGRDVRLRRFDFAAHEGYDAPFVTAGCRDAMVVIEGLHALNPALLGDALPAAAYRISVEPVPKLAVFGPAHLPPTHARLLRRIVRDRHFRKRAPTETIRLWPQVLAGEKKWINPFTNDADWRFDSYLDYEPAVLKNYIVALARQVLREMPDDPLVQQLAYLMEALHAGSPAAVPGDSILRETIGGSQLEY